ncbi:MAG: U32 family peptidase, partial [Lachnospiraceae bacterium]|nr:U32 family peptidase [Candidatus Equihabitans merdae]
MPGKIELLAPAGSIEGFYAVLNAGCDAIYVGADRFSARAYADHPQTEELLHAIDEAHLRGVKVYLTVNTLFKEDEMNELDEFIRPFYEVGLDAVLVQDFGVLRYLHKNYPDLPLHASTQMTVSGPASANLLKKYGVSRVVPARELSLKELKKIHDETGLEVEAFVHGALCYSYSGQCLMSSLIGGRSGNRGRCAQPCRLMYESSHKEGSLLSLKDLCTVDRLKDLKNAGVISLKIEGRMKQSAYAAGVVSVYRQVLDQIDERGQYNPSSHGDNKKKRKAKNNPEDILRRLFSREGFTQGYLDGHNSTDMMAFNQHSGSVKSDESLLDQMKLRYVHEPEPIKINGIASFFTGRQPSLSVSYGNSVAYVEGESILEKASNQVMSEERIRERLCKTGGTSFVFEDIEVYT